MRLTRAAIPFIEMGMLSVLLWIAVAVLVLAGIAGLVIPAMPGAPLLFAGLLLAAWAEDFAFVGSGSLVILGMLAVLTYVVELLAAAVGTRQFGASKQALIGATLGGFFGLFFGLPGIVLGPFIGAVAGELYARGGLHQAGRAGLGASIGFALGLAGKVALGFAMIGIFVFRRFIAN